MGPSVEPAIAAKQSTLQKTLTAALNELGLDAALIAIQASEHGPLIAQMSRGVTPRDIQAIVRALSLQDATGRALESNGEGGESKTIRLRMITPGAKSLLAVPLHYHQRTYGMLVMGRKESATFTKKEKVLLETTAEDITKSLERASLFDHGLIWSRSFVSQEPVTSKATLESFATPTSLATPDMQQNVVALLNETAATMPFDRGWVTVYDPIAGAVEVIGLAGGDPKGEKKDLKAGQRLALETSASGWSIRHRKPRVDHDLASTQGRFQDHKHLYKERYLSALVVPFFIRGQVGGTVTLASRAAMQYSLPDVKTMEPFLAKLADLIQSVSSAPATQPPASSSGETTPAPAAPVSSEPMIRKQERQAALGEFSAFLATEVREPLASIRAQLQDVTTPGMLDFDSQTRVENAMRDLIRVESLLHEILDFAKPLELNRRTCRITDTIENALQVVATDLDVNRIGVTKDSDPHISPVRCDDAKMQQVFLSIFKNALEAMAPGGHLHIEVAQPRASRFVQITVKNDGVPIPTEHVGKVFEPFFTTKRSGTGLGLASVKKIVEEQQGQISIASGRGQGTAVIIRLPGYQRGGPYRGRGRSGRPPRRR